MNMHQQAKIIVVVPSYNEGAVIGGVVRELKAMYEHVVVIDDGSTDQTREVAEREGATLLVHLSNRGQGAALKTGIEYALQAGADIIVTYDSDGQHKPEDIQKLIRPIINGECEVTLGSRFIEKQTNDQVPALRRMLLRCAVVYTQLTTGLPLTDTHNGLRAFSKDAAKKIHFQQERMAHASEILEEIGRKKIPYREVPVNIFYSPYSIQKGQKFSDFVKILFKLIIYKIK
jgi:glycosyltransferase involved in cell wall biosynthesis